MANRLFPALLKFWRGRRGLSQLALSLEADVSVRHLSFLESGRARPSEEMVLRLFGVLGAPLRDQNDALVAAGFAPRFAEPAVWPPEIEAAIAQMMEQHAPYPQLVLALDGTVLRANPGATGLFGALLADPAALPAVPNIYALHFDPRLLRPAVADWEAVARSLLSRLHREALQRGDERLHAELARWAPALGAASDWRRPDLAEAGATLQVRYRKGSLRASFLVTATTFVGPRQLGLEEIRIESCFPLDAETRAACQRLGQR